MSNYRGSEWRKWDLHFHAPSKYTCAKNDQYEGVSLEEKQSHFIEELKTVKDISVIGITDYFSLDGYKMVMENESDLEQFDLILPNIELRLTPVTDKKKKLNLHIIPNTRELSIQEIERFLHKFEFGPDKFTCAEDDLIKLGHKEDSNLSSDEAAFSKGLNEFTISYDTFFDVYNGESDRLKENIMIGISNNSNDGASGIRDLPAIRNVIYSGVHFIFSAQPSDRSYFLGQGPDSIDAVIEKYGDIKPCLHGSDYHGPKDGKTICAPDLNRFCWIKSDPTFEGLQQVIIEPEERVFIGEEPEIFSRVLNNKTKYIEQFNISKSPSYQNQFGYWFDNINIDLNHELVAIIGNKGSGKSAVADIMALCGNFNKPKSFSFLSPSKFRKGNIAKYFSGKIIWASGSPLERSLNENPEPDQIPKVKYLPQGDFEDLTNEIDKAKVFQEEIENVVFSHLGDEEKSAYRNFAELIEAKKIIAKKEIEIIEGEIRSINSDIIKLETKLNPRYGAELQGKLKSKKDELKALVIPIEIKDPSSDPLLKDLNKETLEIIETIRKSIDDLQESLTTKKERKQVLLDETVSLKDLLEEIQLKEQEIKQFQSDKNELAIKHGIKIEDIIALKLDVAPIESLISSKRKEIQVIEREVGHRKKDNVPIDQNTLLGKIENATKLLRIEQNKLDSNQKAYQKYLKDKKDYEERKKEIEGAKEKPNSLKFFEHEIDYITYHVQDDIDEKRILRLRLVQKIFKVKEKIIDIYKSVKSKIDSKIKENKALLEDYNINIDASLVIKNDFESKFFSFVSNNKAGSFYGKESGEARLLKVLEEKDVNSFSDIESILKEIIGLFQRDAREGQNNLERFIDEQVNSLTEFYEYLFSLDYLDYNYKLKLGDKNLEQLSPGERGALLLVFYLLLDNDNVPLILDQPEDNLDNHSVANVLVPFIRRAKQKRQIILVTHNPNLAVVADAEQVIWVDIDKKNKNQFRVISGSIENRKINEKIVNVLEGAMPAFNKRKQKYYE